MKFQHLYLTSFVHLKCYRYCHIIDPSIARLLDFSIFHDQQCHYQNSTPGNFNNKGSLIAINQIDFTNYHGHITRLLPAPSAIPISNTYIKDKISLQHQDANDVITLTPE